MRAISALFLDKIARAAEAEGLVRSELLAPVGIPSDQPVDPRQMILEDPYYGFWETIMRALPRADGFPVRYAKTIRTDDYGALGLAYKTAENAGAALDRAVRYLIVLTDTSWFEVRRSESKAELIFQRSGDRRLGMRAANEAALAEVVTVWREITGTQASPTGVCFRHAAPDDLEEHSAFFGCTPRFEADSDALEVERSLLELPILKADAGLSNFLVEHLEASAALARQDAMIERSVRHLIADALPGGTPTMEDVARRLGLSSRTLQRRLGETQTSFQDLLDDTRRGLATHLLKQTLHPLAEIAFLLGFANQSAFQRAFKRWTGSTPAQVRRGTAETG